MRTLAPPWSDRVDTVLLVAVAAAVVLPGLGSPPTLVFDEQYYVSDALAHLEVGVTRSFAAHPPLGPWLVAAGMALVDGPVGWRLSVAVAALLAVGALHRLALQLLPPATWRRGAAAAAALLLVADGSWLVLGRTAMLDGWLTTLVLAAATAAAVARRDDGFSTRWLVAAGAALGAAGAVKWSAGLAVPVLLVVLAGGGSSARRGRELVRAVGIVGVAAVLTYAAAWIPWATNRSDVGVASCPVEAAPCPTEGGATGVLAQHAMQVRYHTSLDATSTEASPPWTWPLLAKPISFFRPDCHTRSEPAADPLGSAPECAPISPGDDTITYSGSPVVWFAFLALAPALGTLARGRRAGRRRGIRLAAVVALAGWALQWVPWLAVTRTSFLWYLAPTVPFLALGLVAVVLGLRRVPVVPTYVAALAAAVVGLLLSLVPGLPDGLALVGWGLGGLLVTPRDEEVGPGTPELVGLGVLVAVAGIAAAVLHSTWTVA